MGTGLHRTSWSLESFVLELQFIIEHTNPFWKTLKRDTDFLLTFSHHLLESHNHQSLPVSLRLNFKITGFSDGSTITSLKTFRTTFLWRTSFRTFIPYTGQVSNQEVYWIDTLIRKETFKQERGSLRDKRD